MKTRKRWDEVIPRLSPDAVMVVVGVWKGALSFRVLRECQSASVIMVDPWQAGSENETWAASGSLMARKNQEEVDAIYEQAKREAEEFGDRCMILRAASLDAAPLVDDASVDLVFIDAVHTYQAVKEDIAAWLPKVRVGGFISGHDYGSERFAGVKQAVDEAFGGIGIVGGSDHTWFVRR